MPSSFGPALAVLPQREKEAQDGEGQKEVAQQLTGQHSTVCLAAEEATGVCFLLEVYSELEYKPKQEANSTDKAKELDPSSGGGLFAHFPEQNCPTAIV